jgi:hypothetical protein
MAEERSPDPAESASGEKHDEREVRQTRNIARPAGSPTPNPTVGNLALTFDLLHFQYHHPKGFSKGNQNAIEEVLLRAKRTAAAKEIASCDDLSAAKYDWVSEVASGAAAVFGRVAARNKWSPSQVRDRFREYAELTAAAARLTNPELLRVFVSQDWKRLDSALFPFTESTKLLTAKKRSLTVAAPVLTCTPRLECRRAARTGRPCS